jgi:hypothetical protein
VVDPATRALIDQLLLKCLSLAGIARAVQVSEPWLQTNVNEKVPRQVQVTPKKGRLTLQGDELWSFVDNQGISNGFG